MRPSRPHLTTFLRKLDFPSHSPWYGNIRCRTSWTVASAKRRLAFLMYSGIFGGLSSRSLAVPRRSR